MLMKHQINQSDRAVWPVDPNRCAETKLQGVVSVSGIRSDSRTGLLSFVGASVILDRGNRG